jgi:hypothetical protein
MLVIRDEQLRILNKPLQAVSAKRSRMPFGRLTGLHIIVADVSYNTPEARLRNEIVRLFDAGESGKETLSSSACALLALPQASHFVILCR